MGMLDGRLEWHRDKRAKDDLGYRSPMLCWRDLGLAT